MLIYFLGPSRFPHKFIQLYISLAPLHAFHQLKKVVAFPLVMKVVGPLITYTLDVDVGDFTIREVLIQLG